MAYLHAYLTVTNSLRCIDIPQHWYPHRKLLARSLITWISHSGLILAQGTAETSHQMQARERNALSPLLAFSPRLPTHSLVHLLRQITHIKAHPERDPARLANPFALDKAIFLVDAIAGQTSTKFDTECI